MPSEEAGHRWWQAHRSLVLAAFGMSESDCEMDLVSVGSPSSPEYVVVDVAEVRSRTYSQNRFWSYELGTIANLNKEFNGKFRADVPCGGG